MINSFYDSLYGLGSDTMNRFLDVFKELTSKREQGDLFIWSQQGKMCIYLSIWGLLQHQNTSGENPYTPKTPWGENEFKLCLLNLMQALAEEAMSMQDIPLIPNREDGCDA